MSYQRKDYIPGPGWAKECRAYLRRRFPEHMAVVEEYIGEAEYQDGLEYWDKFEDLYAVQVDFRLYIHNLYT